jgi:methylaspartate ammonia-lyase
MRFALIPAALALLAGQAMAQQPRPATCSRDLFQNEAGFRLQQTRLAAAANADQVTQCRTYREHVAYLQKSRSIFATCQSGAQRERNVAEMDSELVNYRALIANRCGGR